LIAIWLAALVVAAAFLNQTEPAQAASCTFVGGFLTLHRLLPKVVGSCLDNARYGPLSGDAFQDTTGSTGQGGLLVWRKATNVAAFTDGYRTWLIGPAGLKARLNTQRFPWEQSRTTSAPPTCRPGDPLANVHDPARLRVLYPCQLVTGTVTHTEVNGDDGDVFISLRLDASEAGLLNAVNQSQQAGTLVLEIVPADQPGCRVGLPPRAAFGTANFGTCTGAKLATPAVGTRISASGPLVLDTNHGWHEIHPVWSLRTLNG
jgi:hypothetical protein